ncbi:MAG: hypothetical protein ACFE9T_13830 [Promethearchaeota archaeon]
MKISGSGRLSGGKINDELTGSGSIKIDGDFECNGFRSSGSMRGAGNLTVHGNVKSSGSFRIIGSLNGDGNARFSGSASVGEAVSIKGELGSAGSFRVGSTVEAPGGIRFSGSARIQGGLLSQKVIDINGSSTINGDIAGEDIFIGTRLVRVKKMLKQPFKVYGNISATNTIDIAGTFVDGDVKGRNVRIGQGTEISGAVYYIDNIERHPKTTLANEPIQIKQNK